MYYSVLPRCTPNVGHTPLALCLAESHRNGEQQVLATKLESLDKGIREYLNDFCRTDSADMQLVHEPINVLLPYLRSIEIAGSQGLGNQHGSPLDDDWGTGDDLVTLSQLDPIVGYSKRTLERWLADGCLPKPDVRGGDGKPNKWYWSTLRPLLQEKSRRVLPVRFPGSRII
jgi:hypothetical protein